MMADLDFGKATLWLIIVSVCPLVIFGGCSDPRADQLAQSCKDAGLPAETIKECRQSHEDYNRIMKPIMVQQEQKEVELFNAALRDLPSHRTPKEQYETVSLKELNGMLDDLNKVEKEKWINSHIFGKRFRLNGGINFHPTDFDNKLSEYTTLDVNDSMTLWQIMADTESLDRKERAFVKRHCEHIFQSCQGEFFGSVNLVMLDQVPFLGLRLEHIQIKPRQIEKSH